MLAEILKQAAGRELMKTLGVASPDVAPQPQQQLNPQRQPTLLDLIGHLMVQR